MRAGQTLAQGPDTIHPLHCLGYIESNGAGENSQAQGTAERDHQTEGGRVGMAAQDRAERWAKGGDRTFGSSPDRELAGERRQGSPRSGPGKGHAAEAMDRRRLRILGGDRCARPGFPYIPGRLGMNARGQGSIQALQDSMRTPGRGPATVGPVTGDSGKGRHAAIDRVRSNCASQTPGSHESAGRGRLRCVDMGPPRHASGRAEVCPCTPAATYSVWECAWDTGSWPGRGQVGNWGVEARAADLGVPAARGELVKW